MSIEVRGTPNGVSLASGPVSQQITGRLGRWVDREAWLELALPDRVPCRPLPRLVKES